MYNRMTKILLPLSIVLLAAVFFNVGFAGTGNDNIYKQLKLISGVLSKTIENYVYPIDYEKFFKGGIQGALKTLDPHTVYFEQKQYDDLKTETRGEFFGIGIVIGLRDNILTVISPIEGTPASRLGLRAGDQIVKIEGKSTKGFSTQDAVEVLRGEKGTDVTITIRRYGETKPMDFTITRDLIEVKSVPYYGVTEDGVGYIRLTRFSEKAYPETRDALKELMAQNVKGIILDLRGNPGGLLNQAVKVASLFLEDGDLVVYTEGAKTYRSDEFHAIPSDVKYSDGKLVVLVNGGSASASEIVSGAIQDHDRGVVIGQRSFGKGLVQSVIPLNIVEGTALKITTAKYFIPSGRCIQKEEYLKWKGTSIISEFSESDSTEYEEWGEGYIFDSLDEDTVEVEKEDLPEYKTEGGRTVYGGGGITPDLETELDKLSKIEIELERKSMFSKFALYWLDNNEFEPTADISEEIFEAFKEFLVEQEFEYSLRAEDELERFEKMIEETEYRQELEGKLSEIDDILKLEKKAEIENNRDYIEKSIKRELVLAEYGEQARYEYVILATDKEIRRAAEIVLGEDYFSYLELR